MLSEEVTIGIYPNGELKEVLIVPDGHQYHLFLTGANYKNNKSADLGSIVIVNHSWMYEGDKLLPESQKEIADYITSYPDQDDDPIDPPTMFF